MPVHWALSLKCSDCGAAITYEDEKPAWKSEAEAHDRKLVTAAVAFTRRYPTLLAGATPTSPYRTPEGEEVELPPYVDVDLFTAQTVVSVPGSERYFAPCPSCGGRAYPATEDAETAPALKAPPVAH